MEILRKIWSKRQSVAVTIIWITLILAAASQVALAIVENHPNELREMTMVKYAIDFSNGINPYSLDVLSYDKPVNAGIYGFLVPLIASPLFKIISYRHALFTMELLTLIVSFIGLILIYKILVSKGASKFLASYGAVIGFLTYYRPNNYHIIAMPGQFGTTLMLFIMFEVLNDEKKGRFRPIYYALLVIAAFYTKQYFVFVGAIVFVYLILRSLKDGLKFLFAGASMGIISMCIVQYVFPLYFSLAIGRAKLDAGMKPWSFSFEQFNKIVTGEFSLPYMAMLVGFVIFFISVFFSEKVVINKQIRGGWSKTLTLVSYEMLAVIILYLPTMYLSRNAGQNREYLLQLWMPYCIIMGVVAMQKIRELSKNSNFVLRVTLAAIIAFTALKSAMGSLDCLLRDFTAPYITESNERWQRAYDILDTYAPTGKIIVPPQLSEYCLNKNIYTDDYGQGQYMLESALNKYNNGSWQSMVFPYLDDMFDVNISYNKKVQELINEGEYDVIALNEKQGNHNINNTQISDKYYELETIDLETGKQVWTTHFYVKKQDEIR